MTRDTQAGPSQGPLAHCVRHAIERYFKDLHGQCPGTALYEQVMAQVEAPLVEAVMRHVNYNQCQAAKILGINRNTLRKKLLAYGLNGRSDTTPSSPSENLP